VVASGSREVAQIENSFKKSSKEFLKEKSTRLKEKVQAKFLRDTSPEGNTFPSGLGSNFIEIM
jgi:hypothetical protein